MRARARWAWIGPLLLLAVGGASYGAWLHRVRLVGAAAVEKRELGLRLLMRDDTGSLERAAAAFAEAAGIDPRLHQARADRTLALLLLAADRSEEVRSLEARSRALDVELSRPEAGRAQADPGRTGPAPARIELLDRQAGALSGEAHAELRSLLRQHGDDAEVLRALALAYALEGHADQAGKALRQARALERPDPWLDLAQGELELRAAGSREKREQAVSRIGSLAAAHPEMLRARVLLARAQAHLGGADAAVATLDGVLAANPGHERARRVKDELLAPPAAVAGAEPARRAPQGGGESRGPGRTDR